MFTLHNGVACHISVGFCVARLTEMGNARALVRGTGNLSSTLFCIETIAKPWERGRPAREESTSSAVAAGVLLTMLG